MNLTKAAAALLASTALLAPSAGHAACKLLQIAEFHLDPASRSPIVDGAINGQPVKILFDTGSSLSLIPRRAAERLGLRLRSLAQDHAYSTTTAQATYATDVKQLTLGGIVKTNVTFQVAGDADTPSDVSLVLGDDFLSQADVEFDLHDNAVRLFEPQGCTPPELVYWGAAYSQAGLQPWDPDVPTAEVEAFVNGKRVLASLATGAGESGLDSAAAAQAGVVRPSDSPAPADQDFALQPVWVGRFDSVAVGDEKVNNVRLSVLDVAGDLRYAEAGTLMPRQVESSANMLLGADFFQAHRVFVDVKDHLVLFSYQGGPVFTSDAAAAR